MQRVAARNASGHTYKDKITLVKIAEDANEAGLPWKAIAEATGEYLKGHEDDTEYAWRIYQVAARAAQEVGETTTATKCFKAALEAYPDTAYSVPAKHSSYQHLVNHRPRLHQQDRRPQGRREGPP